MNEFNHSMIIFITIIISVYLTIEGFQCLFPSFKPKNWNYPLIQPKNNCYSYAFRDREYGRKTKLQPGEKSGLPFIRENNYSCKNFIKNILADRPSAYYIGHNKKKCPCGHYKIALLMDKNGQKKDYHFVRQDNNNLWSHKPGGSLATNLDASGNIIKNVYKANWNYSNSFNYSTHCGNFCNKYDKTGTD